MTNRHRKFFELARRLSFKSTHHMHRHGSVLVKRGTVLSTGYNKLKTHTKSTHPYFSIHSEMDCLFGVAEADIQGSEIYVYRENKLGSIANSQPCKFCYQLLVKYGVKRAYFTTSNGFEYLDIY